MAYSYYRSETVATSQITGTLTDFPALFSHAANAVTEFKIVGSGGHVQHSSGYDLQLYADSSGAPGSIMKTEKEYYNSATGQVICWGKVASIAVGTVVWWQYGDSGISASQDDPTNVWDANFVGVYHWPNGTTLSLSDSTGLTTGTNHGALVAAVSDSVVNGGFYPDDKLDFIDCGSAHNFTTSPFTISFWVRFYSLADSPIPMSKGGYQVRGYYSATGSDGKMYFATNQSGAIQSSNTAAGAITTGTFELWSFIRNGTSVIIAKNGVDVTSVSATHSNPSSSTDSFNWANYISGSYAPQYSPFDEGRVSSTNRSLAWELAGYNNQSAPTTFWTLGSENAVGGGGVTFTPRRANTILQSVNRASRF